MPRARGSICKGRPIGGYAIGLGVFELLFLTRWLAVGSCWLLLVRVGSLLARCWLVWALKAPQALLAVDVCNVVSCASSHFRGMFA